MGLALLSSPLSTACSSQPSAKDALNDYADAIEEGDYETAYEMLSPSLRRGLSFEQYREALLASPEETRQTAKLIREASSELEWTATVREPDGRTLNLRWNGSRWLVDGANFSPLDMTSPEGTIRTFIWAARAERFDILSKLASLDLRFPVTEEKLREAWGSESNDNAGEKPSPAESKKSQSSALSSASGGARYLEQLCDYLELALEQNDWIKQDNQAVLVYSGDKSMILAQESGHWKIREF